MPSVSATTLFFFIVDIHCISGSRINVSMFWINYLVLGCMSEFPLVFVHREFSLRFWIKAVCKCVLYDLFGS